MAGEGRVNGFRQAISLLNPEFDVEVFRLADVDRIENLPYVNHIIRSCPTDIPIGMFAANDETALGMLQAIYNAEMRNVVVVGCDCTREMRLAVDRNQTTALATVDTDIRGQAQKIVQAACAKMIESWNRNCIR
jgi:ABC-type sugar transport system substrate-binding protein